MNALPALTAIANDAVSRQFTTAASRSTEPTPRRAAPARTRAALAALLERAAHVVAPAGHRPAH